MMMRNRQSPKRLLIAGVSALALTAIAVPAIGGFSVFSDAAYAQESGGQGQGAGGQGAGGNGGQGQGGQGTGGSGSGHDSGSGDSGSGHDGGSKGAGKGGADGSAGQGGPSADSEGKGPQAGEAGGNAGGKPVWAQEGIPEVELGRLNVARSPDKVLARSLAEVISNFDPATMASLYELTAAQFAAKVLADWDTISIIDSPLENLALLDQLWTTGTTGLPTVDPASVNDLAAIFIGTASDKNVEISNDTVKALAAIFGVALSDSTISTVAAKAEDVREAISAAHG